MLKIIVMKINSIYILRTGVKQSFRLHKILLLLLMLLPYTSVKAGLLLDQYNRGKTDNDSISKSLSKHVIIAFDDFVLPQFSNALLDGFVVREKIRKALHDLGLKKGDYYSLVNFSISAYDNDINKMLIIIIEKDIITISPFINFFICIIAPSNLYLRPGLFLSFLHLYLIQPFFF